MSEHEYTEAGKGGLSVKVRGDNIDKAIKQLKKKVMNDGLLRELKQRMAYEKPGARRRREKAEARKRYLKALAERKAIEGY